jgi:16S rRNA (uracil1498-N3)-methyltransferase
MMPILTQTHAKMLNERMSASRLFLSDPITAGQECRVDGDKAHYILRVLRLRLGDTLCVFDGSGFEYPAELVAAEKRQLLLAVGQSQHRDTESPLSIHLVQAISRAEKMDFSVRKATELGVCRISPVLSDRGVVRLDGSRADKRREHWQKIVRSACEQCGRNIVPPVELPQPLSEFLDRGPTAVSADEDTLRIVLLPGATASVESLPDSLRAIDLLTGPEGGFSDAEIAKAEFTGFRSMSLGPRVLRTETAAMAAIAVLQSRFGDLG